MICGLLALSACGSASTTQPGSEPQTTAKVTPAIESIDEPAPEARWQPLPDYGDAVIKTSWDLCFSTDSKTQTQDDCAPNADEVQHLRQMEAEFDQAVQPAKGTVPRAIAQLRLTSRGPKARARFITWHNDAGKLCVETEEENGPDSGDGGPSGPCEPEWRCTKLCVEQSGSSESDLVFHYLLSGLVTAEADDLRITLDDGRVEDIALTGPVVPGSPQYRVFMLDLGRALYRRLELLRGDEVLEEEKVPDEVIRTTRCEDSGPPAMPSSDYQSRRSDRCVERAGPK